MVSGMFKDVRAYERMFISRPGIKLERIMDGKGKDIGTLYLYPTELNPDQSRIRIKIKI